MPAPSLPAGPCSPFSPRGPGSPSLPSFGGGIFDTSSFTRSSTRDRSSSDSISSRMTSLMSIGSASLPAGPGGPCSPFSGWRASNAAHFARSSSSSFRIGASESAISAPSSTPSALTSSRIAHPLIQFLHDVIHDGRDGALLLFRRIIFTWRIVRRLRLNRVLVRVNYLVLADLIQREVLLLHVDRIATFKRRTIESQTPLVRRLDPATDELGRNLCALTFVHTQ